jgi:multicomponent Na+:H+ antiporter subunit C
VAPDGLIGHLNYWAIALLFLLGLYGMTVLNNLVKKLMSMNIMQVSIIMFYLNLAQRAGGTFPVLLPGELHPEAAAYVNPLPHALMLTAIVVSLATTGVALALLMRIYRRYGTLEENDILRRMAGR